MRFLLDVNVLLALAWEDHRHHLSAHRWFTKIGHKAWASSPITQLGFVRISSSPKIIGKALTPHQALQLLQRLVAHEGHAFWTDSINPSLDFVHFGNLLIGGHRQVTDAYLLGLARNHRGKLATFDQGIPALLPTPEERKRLVEQLRE